MALTAAPFSQLVSWLSTMIVHPNGVSSVPTAGAAVTCWAAFTDVPLAAAVMVDDEFAVTVKVVTAKFAVVWFCRTVTLAGTEAANGFELFSVTVVPPLGAGEFNVTVPWPGIP